MNIQLKIMLRNAKTKSNTQIDQQRISQVLQNMSSHVGSKECAIHVVTGKLLLDWCIKEKFKLARKVCNDITVNLNTIEALKSDSFLSSIDAFNQFIAVEAKLSHQFLLLAKIFSQSLQIARECILTAFSLNPSTEIYARLCNIALAMASKRDSVIRPHICEHSYAKEVEDISDLDWNKFRPYLPEEFFGDLISLIMVPRIKTLYWPNGEWTELDMKCQQMLSNGKSLKRKIIEMNLTSKSNENNNLKYVNVHKRILYVKTKNQLLKRLKSVRKKWDQIKYKTIEDTSGFRGFTIE